jgi:hypothetical protein
MELFNGSIEADVKHFSEYCKGAKAIGFKYYAKPGIPVSSCVTVHWPPVKIAEYLSVQTRFLSRFYSVHHHAG